MEHERLRFLEFFAGGGMARLGLAGLFDCVFANDIDPRKCHAYRANFGFLDLFEGDVDDLNPGDVPAADLAWASFPCQDLSLAGARGGLGAPRSGVFWSFWRLIDALDAEGRAPPLIALENVAGLLSSNGGADFEALVRAFDRKGYAVGGLTIDAAAFVPQSRQRLFLVATRRSIPPGCLTDRPSTFHSKRLVEAACDLPPDIAASWKWWRLPAPPLRNLDLAALLERRPPSHAWRSGDALQKLLNQMTPLHRARVEAAVETQAFRAGCVYRRIRDGVQRAEVRYDGLAGCLRTLKGGSSRQLLLISQHGELRLRALCAREAARLMGVGDDYRLPAGATEAFNLLGDGVCVPAVRWLGEQLLAPLASGRKAVAA